MKPKKIFILIATISLALALPVFPTHAQEQWTPELALEVKRVSNVTVSPDGNHVVFAVSEAAMEGERSEWVTQLHLASSDGSNSFQLTQGEKSATAPAWSPDGEWIAFLSSRSGKSNIWIIGLTGEARQVTDVETGVSEFKWSPDGNSIAFTMRDPKTEEEEARDREKRDARVVDEDFKMSHLHIVPVVLDSLPQESRRLTEGEFNVGTPFGGGSFDWSPDGSTIVFTHAPTPKVDDWTKADVSLVDVESGTVRSLATTDAAEGQALYSPDGKWIALTISDDPPTWAFTSRVHLVDANGGEPRPLAPSYDEQPNIVGWSADGRSVLISETHRTKNRLSALPVDGGDPVDISPTNIMVGGPALNAAATHVGFVSQTPVSPPEAYVSRLARFEPTRVSGVQPTLEAPLGRTEIVNWISRDGTEVEGLLTYPVGYTEGARVPLVVIVHGGPTGVFTESFIAARGAYPIAAFAAEGYAILRCNVRGSSGYGREFRYANYGDWGGGDYQDIMSGVDAMIQRGVADPEALGVMGWSYGGYMTSWVITQTDRFKAASVGAGVNNLMSFTGTADIQGFIPDYFDGEYWETFDAWRSHSAMFNIAGVTTPTLIQHGEQDARVPVTQGYELYHAIKRQGVPTKMIVYPRQPHGIREPKLQLDAMKRNLEWFNRWLRMRGMTE